jgi:hypothetical protein
MTPQRAAAAKAVVSGGQREAVRSRGLPGRGVHSNGGARRSHDERGQEVLTDQGETHDGEDTTARRMHASHGL